MTPYTRTTRPAIARTSFVPRLESRSEAAPEKQICVEFRFRDGHSLGFSYMHFYNATYSGHLIEIAFSGHTVQVRGRNLAGIYKSLLSQTLAWVAEDDHLLVDDTPDDESVVEEIVVLEKDIEHLLAGEGEHV
jgi:hypothetical protein